MSSNKTYNILPDKRFIHISDTLILVPYLPHHVPKYHGWISNAEILQQTATEYATLEQEYEMQIKWATDHDKRTCIIVPRVSLHILLLELINTDFKNDIIYDKCIEYMSGNDTIQHQFLIDRRIGNNILQKQPINQHITSRSSTLIPIFKSSSSSSSPYETCKFCGCNNYPTTILNHSLTDEQKEQFSLPDIHCCLLCEVNAANGEIGTKAAVGDVNLFIHDYLQSEPDSESDTDNHGDECCVTLEDDDDKKPSIVEVEIMIAERSARRKGYGHVAIQLIMQYAVEWLHMERFIAKIIDDNNPSISMFKALQYKLYLSVECFNEVHYHWKIQKAHNYPFFPQLLTRDQLSLTTVTSTTKAVPSLKYD